MKVTHRYIIIVRYFQGLLEFLLPALLVIIQHILHSDEWPRPLTSFLSHTFAVVLSVSRVIDSVFYCLSY